MVSNLPVIKNTILNQVGAVNSLVFEIEPGLDSCLNSFSWVIADNNPPWTDFQRFIYYLLITHPKSLEFDHVVALSFNDPLVETTFILA